MALMEFREPNQVKWVGTRPGHNGTQLLDRGNAVAGNTIIYTVPAGSTLFLCWVGLGVLVPAAGWGYLAIRNAVPAIQLVPLRAAYVAGTRDGSLSAAFYPPIELTAGWDILVNSSAGGLTVYGEIFGWVE